MIKKLIVSVALDGRRVKKGFLDDRIGQMKTKANCKPDSCKSWLWKNA